MSAAYEYRKVYADLITEAGEVLVVYLNYVKVAGVWTARAGVERYQPDGQRVLSHALEPPAMIDVTTLGAEWTLALELSEGPFELLVRPRLGGWRPPIPPPAAGLGWNVAVARSEARARLAGREIAGDGYVDYVRIGRPTRLLHLRGLVWGRVHLRDRTIIFEHLETEDGERWSTGVSWRLGQPGPEPIVTTPRLGQDGRGSLELDCGTQVLGPRCLLHDGDAFDAERVPSRLDRWFCELVGGATRERRWLGEATLGGDTATALYESVRFGKAAGSG